MSRRFNGSSQYLVAPTALVTTYPFSVACFFVPRDPALILLDEVLWDVTNASNTHRFRLLIEGNTPADRGKLRFVARAAGTTAKSMSTGTVLADVWNHALGVEQAADNRRVYLNGTDKGINFELRDTFAGGLDRTAIGAQAGTTTTDFLNGVLAHLAVWLAAFDDRDAAALAAGVSPLCYRREELLGYWPLNGQDPEPDVKDYAFNFNVVGAPMCTSEPTPMIGRTIVAP